MAQLTRPLAILASALLLTSLTSPSSASSGAQEVDLSAELARAEKLLKHNGITRAIPHLEKVLSHDPYYSEEVPFVLGQIYEHKQETARAVALYRMYLEVGQNESRREQASASLARLSSVEWRELVVEFDREDVQGEIRLFGSYVIAREAHRVALRLPPGDYEIFARALDHEPETFEVTHGAQAHALKLELQKQLFHGGLMVHVASTQDYAFTITQHEAYAPRGVLHDPITGHGPQQEPLVLPTGRYLVEIEAPDFDHWMRRVEVTRHMVNAMDISLVKALPIELRDEDAYNAQQLRYRERQSMRAASARIHAGARIGKIKTELTDPINHPDPLY